MLLGEIIIAPFHWVPKNYLQCNGQAVPYAGNEDLAAALGAPFGTGRPNFHVPDLRGATPVCFGNGPDGAVTFGEAGGSESITLKPENLPAHKHLVDMSSITIDPDTSKFPKEVDLHTCGIENGEQWGPMDAYAAKSKELPSYNDTGDQLMSTSTAAKTGELKLSGLNLKNTGEGSPIDNYQPALGLNFLIRAKSPFNEEDYVGYIKLLPTTTMNKNAFLACNGQSISYTDQSAALYSVLQTTYGGKLNYPINLPNLQGLAVVHTSNETGDNVKIGTVSGRPSVTLTEANLPAHSHTVNTGFTVEESPKFSTKYQVSVSQGDLESPVGAIPAPSGPYENTRFDVDWDANGSKAKVEISGDITIEGSLTSAITGSNDPEPVSLRSPFLGLNMAIVQEGIYSSAQSAFLGEIRIFAGDYVPRDWLPCNGQLLKISEHQALFSLLRTNYGGDGVTNFGIPDLRGRIPVGIGQRPGSDKTIACGDKMGSVSTVLTTEQLPPHTHDVVEPPEITDNLKCQITPYCSSSEAGSHTPGVYAKTQSADYTQPQNADGRSLGHDFECPVTNDAIKGTPVVQSTGSGASFDNAMPSMAMQYIIATNGSFPSRQ